ncbi:MAG: glycine betaine/L-proline ABC transporter ATP-binding protein [Acholeplasmatales bacterium]|nr:MAG: glycine betaine/L-proline ABC transporter ATP-binding protein [Acholeplasmatales bacterium]
MSVLEVRNVYKIFGKNPEKARTMSEQGHSKAEILEKTGNTIGVNNVSFTVEAGETFVVMGLSGSGKSTLIRCLNRLHKPTYGEVILEGENIVDMTPEALRHVRRKKMSMVFQNFGLFPHRSVIQNVDYGLEIQGIPLKERRVKAQEALALVGLEGYESMKPAALSGGMQQRVGLARALVTDPDILLMDEAFSALDPLIKKNMQDELLSLQEKMKKTIVFITHDLDEALKLGDRIAVMLDGTIVQIGTPEDILTHPANDYVRDFVENVNRARVITASSIMKPPLAVVDSKDGPKAAVRKMENEGISSVFVVDKQRKLKGIVTVDDCVPLIKKGINSLESVIQPIEHATGPDTLIADMLEMATTAQYPIAVVDENHRLLGVVVRVSVIAGIKGADKEVGNDVA